MAEAAADQRVVAQPNKKRQPGLKISIHGGGGILIIGGALIAALLFRRSRANKRRPLPPPPSASDQAEPVEAKGITPTATDDDHDTRMGLQSVIPPIQHEEVFVQDREIIRQTSVNSEIVAATSEISSEFSMSQYRMETILEESPAANVKEIQEEDETLAIKESEEEGSESSYEEQDEIREESSSSSLESSTEAVWPAELIDDSEEKEESNQNVIMSTENTKTKTSDNNYASSSSHSKAITLLLLALILALGLLSLAHRASFTTITEQLRVTEF